MVTSPRSPLQKPWNLRKKGARIKGDKTGARIEAAGVEAVQLMGHPPPPGMRPAGGQILVTSEERAEALHGELLMTLATSLAKSI